MDDVRSTGYRRRIAAAWVGIIGLSVIAGCQSEPATPEPAAKPVAQGSQGGDAAAALMGQFRYDDAVKELRPLATAANASTRSRVDLAIALLNRREGDDLSAAAELLDRVIGEDPENSRALYCRALLLFNEGELPRAQQLFESVVKLDEVDAYAMYYVGQCLAAGGSNAEAASWFKRSRETDPYLRSAYYGEFQTLQRSGDAEAAREAFGVFQKLATNPRARLAELKYTRMGPKAEVQAAGSASDLVKLPAGAAFEGAEPLALATNEPIAWRPGSAGDATSITFADVDGDGHSEALLCRATDQGTTLFARGSSDGFERLATHPLDGVADVNAALWGDYDDDGMVDVYLCRDGPNQLWRQTTPGEWADMTAETDTAGGVLNTIDGACFDFDHDGDLDYLLVNADGPRELLNNDRDGGFRPIGAEVGVAGDGGGTRRVVIADLDRDDDADLIFLNQSRPHEVLRNDRLWRYDAADGFEAFAESEVRGAIALDLDVDGQTEVYAAGPTGVSRWEPADDGDRWLATQLTTEPARQVIALDANGDTLVELVVVEADRWRLLRASDGSEIESHPLESAIGDLAVLVEQDGPTLVACGDEAAPIAWKPGEGRLPFALARLVGRTDKAAEMRSNASGIGVVGVARVGGRWSPLPMGRVSSAAGQGLQPHAIGTGGAPQIDFVRLLWPDGVSQTELGLPAGELRTIAETQRQAGSCPLVFVWDGEQYAFVADLLGAGGIGFNVGRGQYYPPRPEENLLLPPGMLQPKDGTYAVKLGEPMEEVCYFDAVRLVAYDLPLGWRMTLDERFGGADPQPTGATVFYRHELSPTRAVNDRDEDITDDVAQADGVAAPLRRDDRRFIGLTEPHSVTLEFDEAIDRLAAPVLKFDGWVEYAYSQSAFAAWQAGEEFLEPTVEAQSSDGRWLVVAERFGYPAGTARNGSVPLSVDDLPEGTRRLRITTNMQVYWDRLTVIDAEDCPDAVRREAPLRHAIVQDVGFSERRLFDQRRSVYDYSRRPPFGDTRHPAGYYTAFGDATPLIAAVDDSIAIIGPGEEVHLEFAALGDAPPEGWRRRWMLESNGWCKDADLFTRDAGTVGPLPTRSGGEVNDPRRAALHAEYNTRFRSGY